MAELRNLTSEDKNRMLPIPDGEIRQYINDKKRKEYLRQVSDNLPLVRTFLGPEFTNTSWRGPLDKAREYVDDNVTAFNLPTESAQVFAYSLPGIAPIVTVANADWDSIGRAVDEGNYADAVGRFLETGVPGVLDLVGIKPDVLSTGMALGNVGLYQILKRSNGREPKSEPPKIKWPKQKLKPSEDLMWELYRP